MFRACIKENIFKIVPARIGDILSEHCVGVFSEFNIAKKYVQEYFEKKIEELDSLQEEANQDYEDLDTNLLVKGKPTRNDENELAYLAYCINIVEQNMEKYEKAYEAIVDYTEDKIY